MTNEVVEYVAYDFITRHRLSYPLYMHSVIRDYTPYTIFSFREAASKCGISLQQFKKQIGTEDALTARRANNFLILYNDQKPLRRINFSLAHEMGHILLGHFDHREQANIETEADRFAATLICPRPVIYALQIHSQPELYARFNISLEASAYRWQEYKRWEQSPKSWTWTEKTCTTAYIRHPS